MRYRKSVNNLLALVLVLGILTPGLAQQNARDDENLIDGLLRDKLYEIAADKILDFVFKYPQHPRRENMLFEISKTLMERTNAAKAVPLLRCYLQEFPAGRSRNAVRLMLARAQLSTGEIAQAVGLLEGIVADSSYSAADLMEARQLLSEQYLAQERYGAIITLLESSATRNTPPNNLLLLARAYRGIGQHLEAVELLKRLVSSSRRDDVWREARVELSSLYVELARYQDCVGLLESWRPREGESFTEEDKRLLLAKSVSHYHLGIYKEAYQIISALWSQGKEQTDLAGQMPSILMALKEWQSAAEILGDQFAGMTDTIRRRQIGEILAKALIEAGRGRQALRVLRELVKEFSQPDEKAELLLRSADLATDTELKIDLLDEALSLSPSPLMETRIIESKAVVLEKLGRWQEAIDVLSGSGQTGSDSKTRFGTELRIGEILLRHGAFEGAEEAFSKAATAGVRSDELSLTYQHLIRVRIILRRWSEADDAFQRFYSFAPETSIPIQVWRDMSLAWVMMGDYEKSTWAALNAIVTSEGLGGDRISKELLYLAVQANSATRPELVEAIYEQLGSSEDNSTRVSAAAGLIAVAVQKEDWQEASERSQALIDLDAGNWETDWATFTKAHALGLLGLASQKAALLQQMARAQPRGDFVSAAIEELQEMALQKGQYDSALQTDLQFNFLSPGRQYEADRVLRQAQQAFRAGQIDRAITLYENHPDPLKMPEFHRFVFASALFRSGSAPEKALALLNSLEPQQLLKPEQWERLRMLAGIYHVQGRSDQSLEIYRQLLEFPLPIDMQLLVLFNSARTAEDSGRWPLAQQYYERYLTGAKRVEPDLQNIQIIAESLAAHGDLESAAKLYRELQVLTDDEEKSVEYNFRAAEMIELGGREEEAAEEFLKIAYQHPDLHPWPARGRLRAGMIYEKQDRFDAAIRQYQYVAENYPDTEEGKRGAQRLATLRQRMLKIEEEQITIPEK